MLIDSIVRLGKPFLQGGLDPEEILLQISDVAAVEARNFLTKVVLVEMDRNAGGEVMAQWVRWGRFSFDAKGKVEDFSPNLKAAVAVPFVIPRGNPLVPQGRYGIPAYPLYEKHFEEMVKSETEVEKFLKGRLERTSSLTLEKGTVTKVAKEVKNLLSKLEPYPKEKMLGLIVLLPVEEKGWCRYEGSDYHPVEGREVTLCQSLLHPGRIIVADLEKITAHFWESKVAEGEEMGRRIGEEAICTLCGKRGEVVSAYSKAWNWFTTTWSAPLSIQVPEEELVETIALCPQCYQALTYGSNLFDQLTTTLPAWLTKEIFAPVESATAREFRGQPEKIYGGILVLPILDHDDLEGRLAYIRNIKELISDQGRTEKGKASLHLSAITGIDLSLPEELARDQYRLEILYFSGEPGRGDIHLRAIIEDVLPSTADRLTQLLDEVVLEAYDWQERLFGGQFPDYLGRFYSSLPALLSKAFGTTRLWTALASILHRRPLDRKSFIRHAARRMEELGKEIDTKLFRMKEEVYFFLIFDELLKRYALTIQIEEGGVEMKDWRTLWKRLEERKYDDLLLSSVEELGFAAGFLISKYSRLYYNNTDKREYLRDRVLSFGSRLTPDKIVKDGLAQMVELSYKLNFDKKFIDRELLGLVLATYQEKKEEVARKKDDFITSFWAGYSLQTGQGQGEKKPQHEGENAPVASEK